MISSRLNHNHVINENIDTACVLIYFQEYFKFCVQTKPPQCPNFNFIDNFVHTFYSWLDCKEERGAANSILWNVILTVLLWLCFFYNKRNICCINSWQIEIWKSLNWAAQILHQVSIILSLTQAALLGPALEL